jgi:hypothetical protein
MNMSDKPTNNNAAESQTVNPEAKSEEARKSENIQKSGEESRQKTRIDQEATPGTGTAGGGNQ